MAYKNVETARQKCHDYYTAHKDQYKIYNDKNREQRKVRAKELGQERKVKVLSYYSGGKPRCARCGIEDIEVLCIDHINGGGNKKRGAHLRGGANFYRFLQQQKLPQGYQVLCFNCNFKKSLHEDNK